MVLSCLGSAPGGLGHSDVTSARVQQSAAATCLTSTLVACLTYTSSCFSLEIFLGTQVAEQAPDMPMHTPRRTRTLRLGH